MELNVHLDERFLHVLNMGSSVANKIVPVSPVTAKNTDLIFGTKGRRQKTLAVQTLDPLAVQNICFTPWHIFDVAGIDQFYLETACFENLKKRNPIHPR